ncbi:MAG: hypothetical protein ACRCV6_06880 [Formosimonas sp.]
MVGSAAFYNPHPESKTITMRKNIFLMPRLLSVVFFLLFIISMGVSAQDGIYFEKKIEVLQQENAQLKNDIELLTKKVVQESSIADKSFVGISNQLSAASTAVTWVSIILAIASLALGALVAWLSNKTQNAANSASKTLLEVEQVKREALQLKEDTANNLRDLNLRLFDDETTHLLERLQKYPRDISNIQSVLTLRTLRVAHIEMLKKAYAKYASQVENVQLLAREYFLIVGQHAPEQMLIDNVWRKLYNREVKVVRRVNDRIGSVIGCFYDDELRIFAEKCIKPAVSNGKLAEYKNEVSNFLWLLLDIMTNRDNDVYSKNFQMEIFLELMSYIENQQLVTKLSAEFLTKYDDWKTSVAVDIQTS